MFQTKLRTVIYIYNYHCEIYLEQTNLFIYHRTLGYINLAFEYYNDYMPVCKNERTSSLYFVTLLSTITSEGI